MQQVYYKCDREGANKNSHNLSEGQRKRRTSSRLSGCHFKGRGDAKADGSWTFSIIIANHNYNPSLHPAGHSTHQNLSIEQVSVVKGLLNAAMPPQSIQNQLEVTRGVEVPIKELYNIVQQLIKKGLDGKSPIEVLVNLFRDDTYEIEHVLDDDERVTHCFMNTWQW